MHSIHKSLLIASSVLFSSLSIAGPHTWDLSSIANPGNSGTNSLSSSSTNSDGKVNLDLKAYADTGDIGDTDVSLERAKLHKYGSGWGAVNNDEDGDSPEHAFDNASHTTTIQITPDTYSCSNSNYIIENGKCYRKKQNGSLQYKGKATVTPGTSTQIDDTDYDMALLSFDTSVELKEVGFSYVADKYTDFTVLAYDGVGTPSLADQTWNSISDWVLVGSYKADSGSGYYDINSQGVESQHWLIGAFNNLLDPNYDEGHKSYKTDAFKIKGVKGDTSAEEVSAPSAFALLLMGLGGLYLRRNKKA